VISLKTASSQTNGRISFGSIPSLVEYPDLLNVQLESWDSFLEATTPPEKRDNHGLQQIFKMNFPITDARENYILEFVEYYVEKPKYSVIDRKDTWVNKKYTAKKFDYTVVLEVMLALYCLFGVGASIYYLELAAVPFQSLFCLGFGIVSWMSIKHAWLARRRTAAAPAVEPAAASAPAVTITPTEPVAEAVLAD